MSLKLQVPSEKNAETSYLNAKILTRKPDKRIDLGPAQGKEID